MVTFLSNCISTSCLVYFKGPAALFVYPCPEKFSLNFLVQVHRLPSVLIFRIVNHPCSYTYFLLSLVLINRNKLLSSSVTGGFIRRQNNSKCHDCTPLKTALRRSFDFIVRCKI